MECAMLEVNTADEFAAPELKARKPETMSSVVGSATG
jgi:hypothetical protein